jgi:late competence protein required for DNA uptake (superfamily II DNA/RNA helicase)
MRLRRSKEQLGLCIRPECIDRYKRSSQYKAGQGMVTMSTHNQAVKCLRCKTVVAGHEESFFCIYCTDCYCPSCLGYVKYFDMAELDNLIRP